MFHLLRRDAVVLQSEVDADRIAFGGCHAFVDARAFDGHVVFASRVTADGRGFDHAGHGAADLGFDHAEFGQAHVLVVRHVHGVTDVLGRV